MDRAYATFEIKAVDDGERVIEGFTSTPALDRGGDVLDPKGAKFALPMPLLWQHRQDQPLGHVIDAKVSAEGIWIKAKVAKGVRPFIDDAWALIKAGLVRGFSVGWKPLDPPKVAAGAYTYSRWEWFESSAVTIPMNAEATIALVKSIDDQYLAASGTGASSVPATTPAVVGTVIPRPRGSGRPMKTTLSDQIKQFESSRAATVAERDAIMDVATAAGETLDEAQTQQYDELDGKIKSIDAHLTRLRAREAEAVAAAKSVDGTSQDTGTQSRQVTPSVVRVTPNLEPGIEFARAVMCKAAAFCEFQKGNLVSAEGLAKQRYPDNPRVHAYLKTAVAGGTTLDSTWAAPLLADAQTLASEFLDYLRPATIVGKFGTTVAGVSIPSLRRVPFNVRIQGQTSGGSASWVGQGKPKPLTKFDFDAQTLLFTKIAAISVISDELVRFSNPSAEALVRDGLRDAVVARMDSDFIDPAISATSNVRPASITNGVSPLSTAGTSMANVLTDLQNLIEPFILAKVPIGNVVLILPETLALVLALAQNSLGQREFAEISVAGGRLRGFPVITTQYAANESSYGNMVIAVNARDIALADDGQVTVDASREASLQMDDAPSNDSSDGTGASLVSMFQTNSIALRAERVINWKKLRSSAVTFFDDVNWGSIGSPV